MKSIPDLKPATTYPAIVGQVFVALRGKARLSQAQLAKALGVTQATWSRIERAGSAITIDQLAVAARALDVTPSHVLEVADVVAALVDRRGIVIDWRRWEVAPTVANPTHVAIPSDALAPFVDEALERTRFWRGDSKAWLESKFSEILAAGTFQGGTGDELPASKRPARRGRPPKGSPPASEKAATSARKKKPRT